jgi:O-antigen/teichoic acid export membrane protein
MNRSLGRKVSILLSGSVAAQALPLLAAPLLARLYAPDSFGEFGLYVAVTSILAAFANLKYDHAVLLAKNAVAAFHVFVICVMSTATIAVLMSLLILLAPDAWFGSRWFSVNRTHAVWLPVSFILASLTQALISILFRGEQFGTVAKVRVSQAVMTTGLTLSLGFWMPTGTALIASSIAGQGFGVAMLLLLRDSSQPFFTSLRWSLLARCSTRYRRFPVFTAPSDLLNALGTNLPLLFIGSIYGVATAGAYAMAQRALGMPLMLIGAAFSDAYRQSAAKSFAEEGSYWRITVRTFRTLGLIAIVPAVVCAMSAPWLFAIVFGDQWALTGEIVQMLTPVYLFRFVVSPLSYNFYLANRHSEDLLIQIFSITTMVGLFFCAKYFLIQFNTLVLTYVGLLVVVYSIYGSRSIYFASMKASSRRYLPIYERQNK